VDAPAASVATPRYDSHRPPELGDRRLLTGRTAADDDRVVAQTRDQSRQAPTLRRATTSQQRGQRSTYATTGGTLASSHSSALTARSPQLGHRAGRVRASKATIGATANTSALPAITSTIRWRVARHRCGDVTNT
jgi:hypothetical protein